MTPTREGRSIAEAARELASAWKAGLGGALRVPCAADVATLAVCELHEQGLVEEARALQHELRRAQGTRLAWPAREVRR